MVWRARRPMCGNASCGMPGSLEGVHRWANLKRLHGKVAVVRCIGGGRAGDRPRVRGQGAIEVAAEEVRQAGSAALVLPVDVATPTLCSRPRARRGGVGPRVRSGWHQPRSSGG